MVVCSACSTENPDGFKFCGACGAPLGVPVPAREVRKVVTIVFCDLTGSTALGDRTDPEALRATMRGYYDEMRAILERHGGTVEKFVGDAVMAVFGVPVSNEDDALRAVRAAWEMRRAVPALGLQARIGVNTGEVVTGEGDTLVTGDAVNVAARLEQGAAPGEVLIGDGTRRLVRDAVEVEAVEVVAKGKAEPVRAYRITSLDPHASGFARRLDTPLIGRERELTGLRQAYERVVSEQTCHLFTLLGPAGVGKSRLAAEFLDDVDATVVRGRCLDYGEGITLWPVIGVLKELGADDTIERITGSLPASELFWAVRTRLEQAAGERPLVVVFEDVHWGAPAFLDLIDHIADLSRGVPLLLLCLARPELLDERGGWAGGKLNATTTLLEPLPPEAAGQLLSTLDSELESELRDRIVAAAGGNPLYVEEMLALAREDGEVRAPATVQALLQARIDRLPADQRAVMERGAVEGEVFHRQAVVELSGEEVDLELTGLVRKELIRPERAAFTDDSAFRFRHLLIRDAAYEALPKEARADLHERFARWLDARGGLVELDEIVGYHLEQAARYRSDLGRADASLARAAAERLGKAGLGAIRREDIPAAVNLIGRALELLPAPDPVRWTFVRPLATTLVWSDRQELLEELIRELEQSPDERVSMHGRVLRADRDFHLDPTARGGEIDDLVEAALEMFTRHDDREGLVETWLVVANRAWLRCRAVETLEAIERAANSLDDSADSGLTNRAYSWMMGPLTHGPFAPDFVRERTRRAVARSSSRFVMQGAHMAEAILLRYEGRFDEAHAEWERGDAILGDLGLVMLRAVMQQIPADIAFIRGDLDRALALYQTVYDQLGSMGERGFRSTTAISLGTVHYALGDREAAERLAHEGEEMGGADDLTNAIMGPALRARIAADRGEHAAAEALVRDAVALSEDIDLSPTRAEAFEALAHVLRAQGRLEEARAAVREQIAQLELHGDTVLAGRARALLVEL